MCPSSGDKIRAIVYGNDLSEVTTAPGSWFQCNYSAVIWASHFDPPFLVVLAHLAKTFPISREKWSHSNRIYHCSFHWLKLIQYVHLKGELDAKKWSLKGFWHLVISLKKPTHFGNEKVVQAWRNDVHWMEEQWLISKWGSRRVKMYL